MRKYSKQIIAMILALCALVSFAMPTVFASNTAVDNNGGQSVSEETTPVVYEFYTADRAGKRLSEEIGGIKDAYDDGASNWRFEMISNVYQMRPNAGQNSFASGTKSVEIVCSKDIWFAVRIQSPGEGMYDLTLTHGAKATGATAGGVYIVDAEAVDAALGANAEAYAEAIAADPYQENGATELYTTYRDALSALLTGKESVINPNYNNAATLSGQTATGRFGFKADKEYVVFFRSEGIAEGQSTARLLVSSLKATYSADQSGVEVIPEPTTYQFYNADWKENPVRNHTAEIKAAYDEGTSNWRYESINNAYQMRPNGGQNSFASGTKSVEIVCGKGVWFAVRIQSPGTGMFDLTLTHGAKKTGATSGGVYIIEADVVDEALGEDAAAYAEAMSADPYQDNGQTDAFLTYLNVLNALVEEKTSVMTPNYNADSTAVGLTATGRYGFVADEEYVVVFRSEGIREGESTARLLLTSLTATYAEDQGEDDNDVPAPTDDLTVSFKTDATAAGVTASTYFQTGSLITAFNTAYKAKSIQWAPYTGSGATLIHSNGYAGGARLRWNGSGTEAVLEIENSTEGNVYAALKFRAPGTGKYKLVLDYTCLSMGDADASEAGAYILEMPATAYTAATLAESEGNGAAKATFTPGNIGSCDSGEDTVALVYGKEYIIVFYAKADIAKTRTNFAGFSLNFVEAYVPEEPTEPSEPVDPPTPPTETYTDGLYDFYKGAASGASLQEGLEDIAAKYDAGVLNWKYETHLGLSLEKASYTGQSMRLISAATWWIAFRVKAPGVDGSYNIQMTHGAGGQGAQSGEIYVIPGDTATDNIVKVMTRTGAAMNTDWFYGETTSASITGRQSEIGTVNMEAGKEYIVIFKATETSKLSKNGYMWLGQLQATRVGDLVEDEGGDIMDDAGYYEFYHYDYIGDYLFHYKTEEELGKKIVNDEIAQEYEEGLINWKHESSSGFARFNPGTAYLDATIGESYPFVLRIKAPGTGTYQIEYTHYVTSSAKAADYGYVYIVAATDKEYDYTTVRDECAYKDPIITTSYKAEKNGFVTVTGEYTAFEEGKEYFLCFDVADADNTKKPSIYAYPQSMQMTRTGDWKPEPGQEPDDGTVYNLMLGDEYKNKYLWHSSDPTLYNEVTKRFENGSLNWRLEAIGGQAVYSAKYLKIGTGKEGGTMGIRIKAPGTGKYKLTLKYLLGNDIRDANYGEIYFVEAPEKYIDGTAIADKMARAPIATGKFSHSGNGMQKATLDGTVNMEAGKEYIVIIYLADPDNGNTTKSTWAYLDRLVFKRIGEFEPEPEHFNKGGLVAKDAVTLFRTSGSMAITEVNGHDYLAMAVYGGTMMLYDLDEWRLIDEVLTGVPTPRGVDVDNNGNIWVTGDTKRVFSYNPYTLTGQIHDLKLQGGSAYNITCGEDGYLYWSTYASTGANLFRMNPETMEITKHTYSGWSCYMADMDQKGDYIYIGVSGEERHEMWKVNKYTFVVEDSVDITAEMMTTRYIDGVEFLDDNYLWFAASSGFTVIDIRTMEKLPAEAHGITGAVTRAISGELDGKRYFVSSKEGLCYYDLATQTFGVVGGELELARTALRGKDYNIATIDDSRLPGKSIITFGGMSADGLNLYAYNVESGANVTLIGLVENSFAYGQDLRELGAGLPGSGEIYFSANYEAPVQVYNTLTGEMMQEFATNGQGDSYHWYKDQLYIGNYNGCILTRMENGKPIQLFRLNNDWFYQARIHTISSGDDKVFVGTVPHVYQNGGLIAWYDLNTELTYVVTGPNPEDVYYAKASKVTVTNIWYNAVTGEEAVMEEAWDKDEDGDGVCKYFKGPIPLQSISKVIYRDGLLFGLSAPMGGTSAVEPEGLSAKMFVYDVENMKMIKTIDVGNYISGLPYPLDCIASFEADPEISNKFWGVVAETLFSVTYDRDTNKFTIKEELSFSKSSFKTGTGWFTNDILFKGDDMYILFYKIGGVCRVNRKDTSDYEQLLYNFDSVKDMPGSIVLADDGDLYYTAGTALYVVNLDITEEERAIAKSVQDAIDLIPDEVALADRSVIEAARAAWDAMAPANQPMVNNYQKLEEAEIQLLRLRIADLGVITIEDEPELVAIRKTYATLTLDQRMSIDFLTVSKAESEMSILRGIRTSDLIASIGEVTLAKEQLVRDARASFMALSVYERRLVTNEAVLNAAEARLNMLLLSKSEAGSVDKLIEEIGFVFFDNTKVKAAREAYDALSDEAKKMVENYDVLTAAETTLIVEYVIVAALVAGGATVAVIVVRKKASKKKASAE